MPGGPDGGGSGGGLAHVPTQPLAPACRAQSARLAGTLAGLQQPSGQHAAAVQGRRVRTAARTCHLLDGAHAGDDGAVLGELLTGARQGQQPGVGGGGNRTMRGVQGTAQAVVARLKPSGAPLGRCNAWQVTPVPQRAWLAPSARVTDSTVGIAMGMPPTMMTSRFVSVGHWPVGRTSRGGG